MLLSRATRFERTVSIRDVAAASRGDTARVADGGASEPVLFFPAAPFVVEEDRGGLRVTALLGRGYGEALTLVWSEAAAGAPGRREARTPLRLVAREDDRLVFSARIGASASRVAFAFELASGEAVASERAGALVYSREAAGAAPPSWWRRARVYAVAVDRFEGGHLDRVSRSLPGLAELGIDTIALAPRRAGVSVGDGVDPRPVDPSGWDEEAFARLVAEARARGMRIIVGLSSWRDRLGSEDVRAHDAAVRDAVDEWARRGVDGLFFDAATEVPLDLACAARTRLRARRPQAVVVGEVGPSQASRWRAAGALDAVTDEAFQQTMEDLFAHRTVDVPQAIERLDAATRARGGPATAALRFLSPRDGDRFATVARAAGNEAMVPLAWALFLTWPGAPAIVGDEEAGPNAALVQSLLVARAASAALAEGELDVLLAERDLLVYRRTAGDDVIDIVIHLGGEGVVVELPDDELPGLERLAAWGSAATTAAGRITLGPRAAIVLRRHRGTARLGRVSIAHNARLRDAEFATSARVVRSWPSRLDFAITERCNLRCAHCITFAPERTRRGEARTLSPWMLDRLREAMSRASYFGFVHGGESLTAPVLGAALAMIARARGDRDYVVHLLTNGVRLTERVTRDLLGAGVRSIAVSLDGARAETNDAVRLGGRFEAIVANVRAAVRVRREVGADLRLGLSLVVMPSNVDELDAFVELAASMGVDWVKLEELAPVTPFAARSLLALESGPRRARDAVLSACARAESLGLVAVDHTAPPPVWRCQLDPRSAKFLAADEFANRSTIHPCRAAWEHACIEPDGEVKLGDFFGPSLGNLADSPLEVLWSGPEAARARERAPASRLCGRGPLVCVDHAPRAFG